MYYTAKSTNRSFYLQSLAPTCVVLFTSSTSKLMQISRPFVRFFSLLWLRAENKMSLSLCTTWMSLLNVKATYLGINEKGCNSSALRGNRVIPLSRVLLQKEIKPRLFKKLKFFY